MLNRKSLRYLIPTAAGGAFGYSLLSGSVDGLLLTTVATGAVSLYLALTVERKRENRSELELDGLDRRFRDDFPDVDLPYADVKSSLFKERYGNTRERTGEIKGWYAAMSYVADLQNKGESIPLPEHTPEIPVRIKRKRRTTPTSEQ